MRHQHAATIRMRPAPTAFCPGFQLEWAITFQNGISSGPPQIQSGSLDYILCSQDVVSESFSRKLEAAVETRRLVSLRQRYILRGSCGGGPSREHDNQCSQNGSSHPHLRFFSACTIHGVTRKRSNFKGALNLVVLRLHYFQERARNPAPLRLPVVRTLPPLCHRICGKCQEDCLLLL